MITYENDEDAILGLKLNMERVEAIANNDSLYIRGIGLNYRSKEDLDTAIRCVKGALRHLLDTDHETVRL